MSSAHKQKICWNCEAEVSRDASYCPFCGSDLLSTQEKPSQSHEDPNQILENRGFEESLADLYKPPYALRSPSTNSGSYSSQLNRESEAKKPRISEFTRHEDEALPEEFEEEPLVRKKLGGGWSLILLSLGSQLFLLGIMMVLFSQEGKLTLEWNSEYWFLYCLLGVAPIYFGIQMLRDSKHEEFEELD